MSQIQIQVPQSQTSASPVWAILPGLLWFALAVFLLFVLRKELRQIFAEFAWRLRSGAAIKVASVELGSIMVVRGGEVPQQAKQIGARPDKGQIRELERTAYRDKARDVMLVHSLYKSREPGQVYDVIIYVVPHKQASLAGISRVEYFLGRYWGNKVFPSSDRSRGFAIATAAYGPMLCTAELFFNDGTSIILHRYVDFEMGAYAPGRAAD